MIIGIGFDLCEISRIDQQLKNERFLQRFFFRFFYFTVNIGLPS